MFFFDVKIAFDKVNHWTQANQLLDRHLPLHIVKLFIFWYREQEFMVRWGNSLSITFRCSNGIRQGGQLSPLLYYVYTDDKNHHLQATGVGCYCRPIHSLFHIPTTGFIYKSSLLIYIYMYMSLNIDHICIYMTILTKNSIV